MTERDMVTSQLLSRLADPDEGIQQEARDALYLIWAPPLYRAAKSRGLSDEHSATSCVGDTLMCVYLKHDQFDAKKGTTEQWIWGIFRNQMSTSLRKTPPPEEELAQAGPSASQVGPEEYLERAERCVGINRAWERLDDAHRQELGKKRKPGPVSRARKAALEQFRQLLKEEGVNYE